MAPGAVACESCRRRGKAELSVQRLWSILRWDGVLPLGVSSAPTVLHWLFPRRPDACDLAAFVLVPIVAALIRCHVGMRQWQANGRCAGPLRQLLLGLAIAVLLLFEMAAVMLQLAEGVPTFVWLTAAVLYFAYFILACGAFWPNAAAGDKVRDSA